MQFRHGLSRFLVTLLLLPLTVVLSAAEGEKVIAAQDAHDHIGKTGTFELTVRTTKNAVGKQEYYLDSEEDFHDAKNLALVISYEHAELFKKAGVDDPSEYYMGKTIRVTGKVISENDQVRIRVEDPGKIQLVKQNAAK